MQLLTVSEAAARLRLSLRTATRLFEDEPGILILQNQSGRRRYRSIRIPEDVFARIVRRMTQA
jgi:hypothetical protein